MKKLLLATVAAFAIAGGAQAATTGSISAGFSFLPSTLAPTDSVLTATTFTLPGVFLTGAGDFTPANGVARAGGAITLTMLNSFVFDTGVGTFNASVGNRLPGVNAVDFVFNGTFTGAGPLVAFATPIAASLIIQFNQAGGAGNAGSGAFSLAVPPDRVMVPAPAALLVLGAGLLGLGLVRARKA